MNAMRQITKARAMALKLRASAKACGPEQGPLRFRLMRAAESLDAVTLIAVHALNRVCGLERELQQLRGAGQGGAS